MKKKMIGGIIAIALSFGLIGIAKADPGCGYRYGRMGARMHFNGRIGNVGFYGSVGNSGAYERSYPGYNAACGNNYIVSRHRGYNNEYVQTQGCAPQNCEGYRGNAGYPSNNCNNGYGAGVNNTYYGQQSNCRGQNGGGSGCYNR